MAQTSEQNGKANQGKASKPYNKEATMNRTSTKTKASKTHMGLVTINNLNLVELAKQYGENHVLNLVAKLAGGKCESESGAQGALEEFGIVL